MCNSDLMSDFRLVDWIILKRDKSGTFLDHVLNLDLDLDQYVESATN